jgi:2-(1,2-epoxy-1,2-dihydrophenyl)acetyl-CoA isomerase
MPTDLVTLEVSEGLARLALNRPNRGNAIDLALARELLEAVSSCDADSSVRCVLLTGSGEAYCVGGDLRALHEARDGLPRALMTLAGTLHAAIARLARMGKPLVNVINGPAAGAGLSLALLGDYALASRSAHFTAAYGAVGLSPDGGMSWFLPRVVGLRRAQEMILFNRHVSADEALAMGMLNEVVEERAGLSERSSEIADRFLRGPTAALGKARRLLLDGAADSLESHLDRELRAIVSAGGTADAAEGVTAFMAHRRPHFSGAN